MMISTRGRYCLRVMLDLAEHQSEGYVRMKDVADRQGLSLKYLEKILPILVKNDIVDGIQGKGGGYRLSRDPAGYTIGEILLLTEGTLAPVACLECEAEACVRAAECRTRPIWAELDRRIREYLNGVTLADLLKNPTDAASIGSAPLVGI